MSGGMGGKAGAGAGGTGGAAGAAGSGGSTGFTLTTPAWTTQAGCSPTNKAPCGIFPRDTTQLNGGKNQSPELNWTAGPPGTQSYAMMLHDLSNIQQNAPYVHWVMWNIPGSVMQLPANLEKTAMPSIPAGSSQRSNNNNSPGYQGSGKCGNVYEFVVWALPTATFAAPGGNQTAVANALKATNAPMATLRATSGPPECTL